MLTVTEKKNKLAGLAFERSTLAKQTAKAASDGVTGLRNTLMKDVLTQVRCLVFGNKMLEKSCCDQALTVSREDRAPPASLPSKGEMGLHRVLAVC